MVCNISRSRDESTSCTTRSFSISSAHRPFYLLKCEALTPTAGTIRRVSAIRILSSTRQSYNRWKRFNVSWVSAPFFSRSPGLDSRAITRYDVTNARDKLTRKSHRRNRRRSCGRSSGSPGRATRRPVIARGWKTPPFLLPSLPYLLPMTEASVDAIWFLLAIGREYHPESESSSSTRPLAVSASPLAALRCVARNNLDRETRLGSCRRVIPRALNRFRKKGTPPSAVCVEAVSDRTSETALIPLTCWVWLVREFVSYMYRTL